MTQLKIQVPEKLGAIFQQKENIRYRVAYGGRGSAKSITFARMLLLSALEQSGIYLCCRELQKSIKTSVHNLLVAEIKAMGLESAFDWGREYLRTADGKSEFLFFGLRSNAEEIKSTHGVKICWVEEAQAVSQFSIDMLLPTIREDNSEIWFTFNPQDELDPVYDMFVTNPRMKSAICEINYIDNPWFPSVLEDERLECLRTSPEKYNWIWLGQLYVNVEASVYGKWVENARQAGRFIEGLYDPELPVFTGWDLGYSDDTAIWWFQVAGNEVRLIDYYENNRQDPRHYAEQIHGRYIPKEKIKYGENGKVLSFELGDKIPECAWRAEYKYGGHYVPHDAANKLFQAGGRSAVQQFQEFGINTTVRGSTTQQTQIDVARKTIDLSYFDPVKCKQGIRCLKKYEFADRKDERGYSRDPVHGIYSHGADAYEIVASSWRSAKVEARSAAPVFFEQKTVRDIFFEDDGGGGYRRI